MKEKKMTQQVTEKAQKSKKKQKKAKLQTETAWIGEKGNTGDMGPQGPKGLPGCMYGYSKKDIKRMKKGEKRRQKREKKRRTMEKKLNEILLWCEEENYSVKDVKCLAECLKNGAEDQKVRHKKAAVQYLI